MKEIHSNENVLDDILKIVASLYNKHFKLSSTLIESSESIDFILDITSNKFAEFYKDDIEKTKKILILTGALVMRLREPEKSIAIKNIKNLKEELNLNIETILDNYKETLFDKFTSFFARYPKYALAIIVLIFAFGYAIFDFFFSSSHSVLSNKTFVSRISKYKGNSLKTGDSPYESYFGRGIFEVKSLNELKVFNGQGTDVILCLIEKDAPYRTIRNVYIRENEQLILNNIPNGLYYIKTFHGKYWNPDTLILDGKVKGFFDTLAGFSVSNRESDLIRMYQTNENYSKYTLRLYPVVGGNLESIPINQTDFFK